MLPRLDVSEMRRIAEEGAMWAKAGEPGRLFRALGEAERELCAGDSEAWGQAARLLQAVFRAAIHTGIIA